MPTRKHEAVVWIAELNERMAEAVGEELEIDVTDDDACILTSRVNARAIEKLWEHSPQLLSLAGEALASRWVPVATPPTTKSCGCIGFDRFYGRVGEANYVDGRFTFIDSDDCSITHWMPLPAAPKPESQE